jgi:hypothetical protein
MPQIQSYFCYPYPGVYSRIPHLESPTSTPIVRTPGRRTGFGSAQQTTSMHPSHWHSWVPTGLFSQIDLYYWFGSPFRKIYFQRCIIPGRDTTKRIKTTRCLSRMYDQQWQGASALCQRVPTECARKEVPSLCYECQVNYDTFIASLSLCPPIDTTLLKRLHRLCPIPCLPTC